MQLLLALICFSGYEFNTYAPIKQIKVSPPPYPVPIKGSGDKIEIIYCSPEPAFDIIWAFILTYVLLSSY
jgi:hypothetical protein